MTEQEILDEGRKAIRAVSTAFPDDPLAALSNVVEGILADEESQSTFDDAVPLGEAEQQHLADYVKRLETVLRESRGDLFSYQTSHEIYGSACFECLKAYRKCELRSETSRICVSLLSICLLRKVIPQRGS